MRELAGLEVIQVEVARAIGMKKNREKVQIVFRRIVIDKNNT